MTTPTDILDFWYIQSGPKHWFEQSDAFDAEVRARYESVAIDRAASLIRTVPHSWEDSANGALALIIALDQFPRNMYRATPAAFAWDSLSRGVAMRMVASGADLKIPMDRRAFIYMPYMHAEDLDMQNACVRLCDSRLDNSNTLHHAKEHRKVIERFGRFPHRNKILGRKSTAEEQRFLDNNGYAP